MTELKPCPFCKSSTAPKISSCIDMEECANYEACESDGVFCVCCDWNNGGCGASGGFRFTEEEAIEAWNTRAEREVGISKFQLITGTSYIEAKSILTSLEQAGAKVVE